MELRRVEIVVAVPILVGGSATDVERRTAIPGQKSGSRKRLKRTRRSLPLVPPLSPSGFGPFTRNLRAFRRG